MTRINLIPVNELTDQHLLAEHREIKRIPNLIIKGKYSLKGQPKKYTMGTGHVKFFYDKIEFLFGRYIELLLECQKRGFKVIDYSHVFVICKYSNMGLYLFNSYQPTQEEINISYERINEKIKEKPNFYKYYGKNLLTNKN